MTGSPISGWKYLWSVLIALLLASMALAAPESVQLNYQVINGFPVKYVSVNLNDPDVVISPAVAQRFPTGLERWGAFLGRLQPDAAINGTYFCLRSFMPVGDVAINGNLLYKGVVGTALCLTPDNQVSMLPGPHQVKPDWTGFHSVLCAGPRLITNGTITIDARAEGFRDPRVLGSAPRSVVALRPDNVLMLITIEQDISLLNLAFVCQHLNAVQAMALDGGNSSALYAWGRSVTAPGRGLSNIIVVYSTRRRYLQVAGQLFPTSLPILASLRAAPVAVAEQPEQPDGAPPHPPVTPTPKVPAQPPVRMVRPAANETISGAVPVTVEVAPGANVCWVSLRINGRLRAMSNAWPVEYHWDSTHEDDGPSTLEVCAWGADRTLLGRDQRQVQVKNNAVTAKQP